MMNHRSVSYWILLVTAVSLLGCGKQEQPAPGGATNEPAVSQSAPRTTTQSAVETAQSVTETAKKVVDQATMQAQALIDQTREFLSEQNYAGAAEGLQKLAGLNLTPEQEALVAELKVEAGKLGQVMETKLGELKQLVAEKKYQEATSKLTDFASVSLTPQQQELLDRLKAEIKKGLSGQTLEAGKQALGGLLPGN
jgi:hypothetical protein